MKQENAVDQAIVRDLREGRGEKKMEKKEQKGWNYALDSYLIFPSKKPHIFSRPSLLCHLYRN